MSVFEVVRLDQAAPGMADAIHAVMTAAYRVEADILGAPDFVPLRRTPAEIARAETGFLGIRLDGDLAAVAEIEVRQAGACRIDAVVVAPSRFREGLATALLRTIIRTHPSCDITVSTGARNTPALQLYAAHAFRVQSHWVTPDGIPMVTLVRGRGDRDPDAGFVVRTPEIVTDRLSLTPLGVTDAEALFAYRSLPEVCRYQSWEPTHIDDAVRFIESLEPTGFDSPGTWFQLGIRLRESGRLVGDLGVHFLEDGCQVEIGFTLEPASQGSGLATEAVVGLLDHLFRHLGKHRVSASVDPRNAPSLKLLQRVGMRQEAHFRESLRFKGEWADDMVFAVLASEWDGSEPGGDPDHS